MRTQIRSVKPTRGTWTLEGAACNQNTTYSYMLSYQVQVVSMLMFRRTHLLISLGHDSDSSVQSPEYSYGSSQITGHA